jgi:hypothetical protein
MAGRSESSAGRDLLVGAVLDLPTVQGDWNADLHADKHNVHEVVAGAAIGSIGGPLLTGGYADRVRLTPWSAHGGGLDWR